MIVVKNDRCQKFKSKLMAIKVDQRPLPRGRSRDEMVVVVTAVAIALAALIGVTVTEGFDWLMSFLATGRAFF